MAERIVSPGVFTRERDLSFLPQSIGEIGAAIIGPTKKGPAFTPTQITSFQQFEEMFGGMDNRFYTPYTVEQYLRSAGVVTVVRVLGIGGYKADSFELYVYSGSAAEAGHMATQSLAVIAPSLGSSGTGDLTETSVTAGGTWSSLTLTVTGSNVSAETYTLSFDTSSANFITEVISTSAQSTKSGASDSSVYVYKVFKERCHNLDNHGDGTYTHISASGKLTADGLDFQGGSTGHSNGDSTDSSWTGNTDYQFARTPYIQSQDPWTSLFRVYSRSHGTDINTSYKINILNLKPAADVPGSEYGTWSLQVRVHNPDGSDDDNVLEQYDGLTFDPASPNYFAKRIGDRWVEIDSNGKLTYYGSYPNLSKYIRVGDFKNIEEDGVWKGTSKAIVPMGHKALNCPIPSTSASFCPSASFKRAQTDNNGIFDVNVFHGINLLDKFVKDDNIQYLSPLASAAYTGNNVTMSLENMLGNDDFDTSLSSTYSKAGNPLSLSGSATQQLKFVVPLQWGFDGRNPGIGYKTGPNIVASNTQGLDCQNSTASGSISYKRAINAVSNADEFDINLLVTPGVIHGLHSTVTNHAISKMESRADAFYVMDAAGYSDSISTVKSTIKALDTNYAAVYYPWVKIVDRDTSRPVWVPPSVVLPGVISYTDRVAHEWFAPAGLNRGGLTTVLEAKTRLTHSERDDLYENKINPIASFPGQGVVVFGQKTLQAKPSALDRINVRRLLIALRKFIASTSRYLVFEQNSQALRNRFLNIVNPYLEQVQSNSGLSAFRVVMDDSNNTPDVVDRNQLVGQIFIQPTRTAEFIVLDFVVQPTGATFPE